MKYESFSTRFILMAAAAAAASSVVAVTIGLSSSSLTLCKYFILNLHKQENTLCIQFM